MKEVIEQIAQENNISVDEVKSEIENAIKRADKNITPESKAFWDILSFEEKEPTIEEFISLCAVIVKRNTENAERFRQ